MDQSDFSLMNRCIDDGACILRLEKRDDFDTFYDRNVTKSNLKSLTRLRVLVTRTKSSSRLGTILEGPFDIDADCNHENQLNKHQLRDAT